MPKGYLRRLTEKDFVRIMSIMLVNLQSSKASEIVHLFEMLKGQLSGVLTKQLMKKHLTNESGTDSDTYLKNLE